MEAMEDLELQRASENGASNEIKNIKTATSKELQMIEVGSEIIA